MAGSSELGGDGEGGCCGVGDCSPGTIVWVRRRNGSWWPGRILGPDELPASQIMSPRSGTPVKLLGREDASVDWYNLEKSKRVKAFRCGEFDTCIERAEASQGTLVKKREKYARREDAILHALELERKQLELKYQNQGFRPDDISSRPFSDTRRELSNLSSEYYSRSDMHESQGKYTGYKAQLPSQNAACAQQRKDLGSTRYKSKKSKKRKEETSGACDTKKEREQHFLHAGSKRKFSESLALGSSENSISNHMDGFSYARHLQGGTSLESDEKNTAIKKKKSEGSVFEESLVKKCDRHQPLVPALQTTANLPHSLQHNGNPGAVLIGGEKDPLPAINRAKRSKCMYLPTDSGDTHSHDEFSSIQMTSTAANFETEHYLRQHGSFSEERTSSGFVEKHESGSSGRECSETETEDDSEYLQSVNKLLPLEPHVRDHYSFQASDKLRRVDNNDDDANLSTCMPQLNGLEEEDGSSELGVSQWHMKGKRNNRNAAKRPMDTTDGNPWLDKSNGFMSIHRTSEGNTKKISMETSSQHLFGQDFYRTKEELDYDTDETDFMELDTNHSEANRYYDTKYPSSVTRDFGRSYAAFNDFENDSCMISPLNRDLDQISRIGRNVYREGSSFYQRNYGLHVSEMGPMLFDINLKVQASYQGEHVPLVSLMSRLNGKAIVGHPVQIEILDDGSTSHLVSSCNISLGDGSAAPPVWRTGRRTAMQRVPRSNPARATLDGDYDRVLLYPEWEMKPPSRKCSVSSNHQVRLAKKSISNARRPSSSKSQTKSSKKGSLSSQKIRTLSSIATGKKHHGEGQAKAYRRNDVFGGLIKPEGTVPLVTCVPAKVVFSRILEAVGRPSVAIAHRVRMSSPAVQDPP